MIVSSSSVTNAKAPEGLGLRGFVPAVSDVIDPGAWGAVVEPLQQAPQCRLVPFSQQLDAAVRQVAHPPPEPQPPGLVLSGRSEEDALHSAEDDGCEAFHRLAADGSIVGG